MPKYLSILIVSQVFVINSIATKSLSSGSSTDYSIISTDSGSSSTDNSSISSTTGITGSINNNVSTSDSDSTTDNSTSPNSTTDGGVAQNNANNTGGGNNGNGTSDDTKPIVQDIKCIEVEASTPGYLKCMIKQATSVEKAGNSTGNESEITEGATAILCINKINIYASLKLKTTTLDDIRYFLDQCLFANGIGAGTGDISQNGVPVQPEGGAVTKSGDADLKLTFMVILMSCIAPRRIFEPIDF